MIHETFSDLFKRRDELNATKIISNLRTILIVHHVFELNYREIIELIKNYENDFQDQNRGKETQLEFCRLLHNYLSSLKSFIDITRNTINEIKNPELKKFVDSKISELNNYEEKVFLENLRNYVLHYKNAPVVFTRSIYSKGDTEGSTTTQIISLEKNELLKWDKWNKKSKEFIEKNGEIYVRNLILNHYKYLNAFYLELYYKIIELHLTDFHKLTLIEKEIKEYLAERKYEKYS